ncbi:hypothetical protein AAG747_18515 [Rapidithrix thailandica]|uniref:Uncharacterized protein n=1 Tax=Rapidithrix thailandica TaxID=413964 RepID=A0AAW9S3Z7_9BACT
MVKAFNPTKEEVEALRPEGIDFYPEGEVGLTYCLPEEAPYEYMKVCFSNELDAVETTFGYF